MPTRQIDLGKIVVGSTRRLRMTIKKDGVPWAGIDTVTLTFEEPGRSTTFERDGVAEDASAGIWYYDTTTTDLEDTGVYTLRVAVEDGAIVDVYPWEIALEVVRQP